jgi:hypothetical protein
MFAILGLGELFVIGVIATGMGAAALFTIKTISKAAADSTARKDDEMRKIRVEFDCLREENHQMREEIKRLREQVSPNADTGIKRS